MKLRSLVRALVIVVLLVLSWMFLLHRLQNRAATPKPAPLPTQASTAATAGISSEALADAPPTSGKSPASAALSAPQAPDSWQEWVDYLNASVDSGAVRSALHQLRAQLMEMPRQTAIEQLQLLIDSGFDWQTGLAFQLRAGGQLLAAASLRALALDWLAQLAPQQAAALANHELQVAGTALVPDVYVVHLRNLTLAAEPSERIHQRLHQHFTRMLQYEPWMLQASAAVAEAFDVAVYLGSADLAALMVPHILADAPSPSLRKAAHMALERMLDQDPATLLDALNASLQASPATSIPRATLFARLDPRELSMVHAISQYLRDSGIQSNEKSAFLLRFPHLDFTLSHNLLSPMPDFSTKDTAGRLQAARNAALVWLEASELSFLHKEIESILDRLEKQLGY